MDQNTILGDGGRAGTPSGDGGSLASTPTFALVVNGHSLVHALTPELERLFLGVAEHCSGEFNLILLPTIHKISRRQGNDMT